MARNAEAKGFQLIERGRMEMMLYAHKPTMIRIQLQQRFFFKAKRLENFRKRALSKSDRNGSKAQK